MLVSNIRQYGMYLVAAVILLPFPLVVLGLFCIGLWHLLSRDWRPRKRKVA